MTIEEIKKSDKIFLNADDIKKVMKFDPDDFRRQARKDPTMLGFPVVVCGSRVKIPRKPFLAYIEGAQNEN